MPAVLLPGNVKILPISENFNILSWKF